ncbi:MAG: hypothetical protein MUO53_18215 [Maribacter sp.]|nr:hypothetical protein [Maribacter sp.]
MLGYLHGGDLRSIAGVDALIRLIKDQGDFDRLFEYLHKEDRLVVMRAADAIEKISKSHPEYLKGYTQDLIKLLDSAQEKELKWHLALLITRVALDPDQLRHVWLILTQWLIDAKESKIVRVNSLQALSDLSSQNIRLENILAHMIPVLEKEPIPSLNARIRKLKKQRRNIHRI